jgi:hypothetical protein
MVPSAIAPRNSATITGMDDRPTPVLGNNRTVAWITSVTPYHPGCLGITRHGQARIVHHQTDVPARREV